MPSNFFDGLDEAIAMFQADESAKNKALAEAQLNAKAEGELTTGVQTQLSRENFLRIGLDKVATASGAAAPNARATFKNLLTSKDEGNASLIFIGLLVSAIIFWLQVKRG